MKCKRIARAFLVEFDNGLKAYLECNSNNEWCLMLQKEDGITVIEMYNTAKSILTQDNEKFFDCIRVLVFGVWTPITRKTTREQFLTYIIGDVDVDEVDVNI